MTEGLPVPLLPGERLIWRGQPDLGKFFMPADAFLVPFHLLFLAVAIFIGFAATRSGTPPFMAAFMLVFVVLGTYLAVGRFFVKAFRKSRTTYAVTDQRAIIHTPWSIREVRLGAAGIELATTGSGRHLTVIFSDPTRGRRGGSLFSQAWANEQYRNSGMEIFGAGGVSPAFYDVADVDGLRAALEPVLSRPLPNSGPPPYGT
jgi:hypothetical protein